MTREKNLHKAVVTDGKRGIVHNAKCVGKHSNQLLWVIAETDNVLIKFAEERVLFENAQNVRRRIGA